MHETGLVYWDDPEGWDGEGGGRKGQDGEHMYNHGWLMWMYDKNWEKAMAPHSSVLAWRIQWTEETGRLQSMGLHRVGHDWSDLAAAAAWQKLSQYCKVISLQLK